MVGEHFGGGVLDINALNELVRWVGEEIDPLRSVGTVELSEEIGCLGQRRVGK